MITLHHPAPAAPAPAPAPSTSPAYAPAAPVAAPPTEPAATEAAAPAPTDSTPAPQASSTAQPEKPNGYALDFPADFKPGIELKIDASAPLAVAAREFAHREGLTQEQFSRMLALYAQNAVAQIESHNRAIESEGKKLGPQAEERGRAVKNWLTDRLGAEAAADLTGHFSRASHVAAFEKLGGFHKRAAQPVQQGAPPLLAAKLWPKRVAKPQSSPKGWRVLAPAKPR